MGHRHQSFLHPLLWRWLCRDGSSLISYTAEGDGSGVGSGANTGQFLGQHLSFIPFWMSIWGTQLPASGRICPCLDFSPSPRRCCLTPDIGLPPVWCSQGALLPGKGIGHLRTSFVGCAVPPSPAWSGKQQLGCSMGFSHSCLEEIPKRPQLPLPCPTFDAWELNPAVGAESCRGALASPKPFPFPPIPKALPSLPQLASSPGQVAHGLYNALSPGIAPPVTQRAPRRGGGGVCGGGDMAACLPHTTTPTPGAPHHH